MPLTDAACRSAKCPDGEKWKRFTDAGGLYLEVSKTGAKSWRWKYRFEGKEKRLSLGLYPAVSLSQARQQRDAARVTLGEGVDPSAAKRKPVGAASNPAAQTFEQLARDWWQHWKGPRSERHADYVIRRLEADVFPSLGGRAAESITARDLLTMAKAVEARGAVDIAKRLLQTSGQVMRYGVAHGVLDRNPASDVKPADALQPRRKTNYPRLDAREMPELLRKIDAYQGSAVTRLAIRLLALTFVRTGELIGASWSEIDADAAEWRIPAERMKMRTPHIVALSSQALEVLETLRTVSGHRHLLFPGERSPLKPMSNNTILKALERMGYAGRMTGHGFRGMASTILHEQGYRHDLIELQLAHQERDRVSASYNHATYLPQRREMMQAWADHLDAMRRGDKPARSAPLS